MEFGVMHSRRSSELTAGTLAVSYLGLVDDKPHER